MLLPITTSEAEGAREIIVPEAEILDPGMSVWPSIRYRDSISGVMILPGILNRGDRVCASLTVSPPMTTFVAEGARLIGVPETVISGPPGRNVSPSMTNRDKLFAVIILSSSVISGRFELCWIDCSLGAAG